MAEPEPSDPEAPEGDKPMPFFEHIAELRTRLIRSVIGIALAFAICWAMVGTLREVVTAPLQQAWVALNLPGPPNLQVLGVFDAFLTDVRIAVTAALFVAAPILFYQLWLFVSPGLYAHEKRYVIPFVMTSAIMFAAGAVFCYFAVLPFATRWFLEYPMVETQGALVSITPQYTFPDYTKYTTKLLIGFGLMFELPLVVFFLAVAGAVTHKTLLRFWKAAIIVIFIVSGFLTPPDPITLFFMALPMSALYFLSVGVAFMVSRKQAVAGDGLPPAKPS